METVVESIRIKQPTRSLSKPSKSSSLSGKALLWQVVWLSPCTRSTLQTTFQALPVLFSPSSSKKRWTTSTSRRIRWRLSLTTLLTAMKVADTCARSGVIHLSRALKPHKGLCRTCQKCHISRNHLYFSSTALLQVTVVAPWLQAISTDILKVHPQYWIVAITWIKSSYSTKAVIWGLSLPVPILTLATSTNSQWVP